MNTYFLFLVSWPFSTAGKGLQAGLAARAVLDSLVVSQI